MSGRGPGNLLPTTMIEDKKIHLLMLSIDRSIWSQGSQARARMEHFGSLVSGIDIISIGISDGGSQGGFEGISLKNNVSLHAASGPLKFISIIKALVLARKLARENTVIVSQDPFEIGLIGLVSSWLTKRPLNVQVHIDFFSPYFKQESLRQKFQASIAPFVLKRAKSIRVVSAKIATYLRDSLGVSASKMVIAPVFVDLDSVRNKSAGIDLKTKYAQFDWIALLACRYVKQKNVLLAIEAFIELKKKHPKAGMVVAGSGPEEAEIRSYIVRNGLTGSVILGSWKDEFASCMKTSDAFIMSSDYEGWGMTIVEAASLGKPIVMTDVGCAREFIFDGKNGLIVPTRDAKALAQAMDLLYSDRALAERLGEAARQDSLSYMTKEESDGLMKKSWAMALES